MKEYNIENICVVRSSKRIFASQYTNKGIPFFRGKEITQLSSNQTIDNILYISNEAYKNIMQSGIPHINDILITAVGTIGSVWLVDTEEPFYFKDGNIIWLSNLDKNVVLPRYLKYYLCSSKFQAKIDEISIGSSQKALTIDAVKKIKITLPILNDQQHIVDILGSIDDKIENNEKKIKKITDYTVLLIQKECKPNTELKAFIKFIKGKKPIENGVSTAPYLSIEAITTANYSQEYSDGMVMAETYDILMVMDGASSGTVFSHQNGIVASTLAKIETPANINDYLYWYLLSMKDIIKLRNTGSAIPHANKDFIGSLLFDYSQATDKNLTEELHRLRENIYNIQKENIKLNELKQLYLQKFFG